MTTLVSGAYPTVEALADYLSIETADHEETLVIACNAASRDVDAHCNQRFWNQGTVTHTYRPFTARTLKIDAFSAITTVKHDSADNGTFDVTWTSTDYQLEPANIITNLPYAYRRIDAVGTRTFPCSGWRRRVQVVGTGGWSAVPSQVQQASLIQAARLFTRHDSPHGVVGGFDIGPIRVSTITDPDVLLLLADFVVPVQS